MWVMPTKPDRAGNSHGLLRINFRLLQHLKTVINLSNQTLDDGTISLLQKGLNYAVAPRAPPIEEMLTSIEKAVRALPMEQAEEARHESIRIIKATAKTKNNLTKNERTAL